MMKMCDGSWLSMVVFGESVVASGTPGGVVVSSAFVRDLGPGQTLNLQAQKHQPRQITNHEALLAALAQTKTQPTGIYICQMEPQGTGSR